MDKILNFINLDYQARARYNWIVKADVFKSMGS